MGVDTEIRYRCEGTIRSTRFMHSMLNLMTYARRRCHQRPYDYPMPHNSDTTTVSHADVGRFNNIPARETQ